jgi:hypothetical protein
MSRNPENRTEIELKIVIISERHACPWHNIEYKCKSVESQESTFQIQNHCSTMEINHENEEVEGA